MFKMEVVFEIDPIDSDSGKVKAAFEQYLRDALYVGADYEDDLFAVTDILACDEVA